VRYYIKTHNVDRAVAKFERMADAAIDTRPAMETIAGLMMGIIKATFESQGRRGGGSWAQLSTEWLLRKQRLGLDPRIGFAWHRLVEAFGTPGAPHQILEIGRHNVTIESDLPYAATQQAHRPFIRFTMRDRLEMSQVVTDHLVNAWRFGE
jgi:phage gpG-like protein